MIDERAFAIVKAMEMKQQLDDMRRALEERDREIERLREQIRAMSSEER